MKSYYAPEKLENFLESLFVEDESTPEDIVVLEMPGLLKSFVQCCVYSYTSYNL